jgi:hypothetical protein
MKNMYDLGVADFWRGLDPRLDDESYCDGLRDARKISDAMGEIEGVPI